MSITTQVIVETVDTCIDTDYDLIGREDVKIYTQHKRNKSVSDFKTDVNGPPPDPVCTALNLHGLTVR